MSTLKAEALTREFHDNGIRIPDPGNSAWSQVRDLLTAQYPEIATASVTGPEATATALRYRSPAPSEQGLSDDCGGSDRDSKPGLRLRLLKPAKLLVRHLQCRESCAFADCIVQAMDRYIADEM